MHFHSARAIPSSPVSPKCYSMLNDVQQCFGGTVIMHRNSIEISAHLGPALSQEDVEAAGAYS